MSATTFFCLTNHSSRLRASADKLIRWRSRKGDPVFFTLLFATFTLSVAVSFGVVKAFDKAIAAIFGRYFGGRKNLST